MMRIYLPILLATILSCQTKVQTSMAAPAKESLTDKAKRLASKYNLTQTGFDTECIYSKGDLTKVLSTILKDLLPEEQFQITETISADGKQYVAAVKHNNEQIIEIVADTHADFLPDTFSYLLESIPKKMGSDKRFFMVNPRLLGQDVLYFCGTETNLKAAKKEGLPLIYSGEDFMEMDISEFE